MALLLLGAAAASGADTAAPTTNFLSSLKQAFAQDFEHEVVRGHFDVGTAPNAHRYYCLVDAATGKREANGVSGQPALRPDGMTGIKPGAAVSLYRCDNAEQQGILVTTGYVLTGNALVPAAPAAGVSAVADKADALAGAAGTVDGRVQTEVMAVYARFIAGQNAHDRGVVSDVLLDSKDFVSAPSTGNAIWGHAEALQAFQDDWKGGWTLAPQLTEARVASVAPDVAVLITRLLITHGDPSAKSSTVQVRWGGVFVKIHSGWRISSIFITPLAN